MLVLACFGLIQAFLILLNLIWELEHLGDATKNYLEAEDYRAAWLEDCFELKTGAITSTEVCIRSWESWSKSEGINVELHPRMLAELLEAKGCIRYRNKERQRGWQGIQIKDLFYAGLNS